MITLEYKESTKKEWKHGFNMSSEISLKSWLITHSTTYIRNLIADGIVSGEEKVVFRIIK